MKRISEKSYVVVMLSLLLCFVTLLGGCAPKAVLPEVWDNAVYTSDTTVGEGAKTVKLYVTAAENTVVLTVRTDAEKLGDALLALNLISGDSSEYGLYVKVVNGMTADYDTDGSWWFFNKVAADGTREMMPVGVDGAVIADGESYELAMTK